LEDLDLWLRLLVALIELIRDTRNRRRAGRHRKR